jgi:NDP-sugar pyrophosphorylase family protein
MKAVILAGGEGRRLLPYTTVFPKPLMPVGDMPILEIVIRQIKQAGFDDITLAVGHLEELLMAFFGDGSRFGVHIQYSREEQPLGTAGPLSLIPHLNEPFLVMNGDLLTTLDYRAMWQHHSSCGAIATLATFRRDVQIDLGVLQVNEEQLVEDYKEKPVYHYTVSTGIYVFAPAVLKYIAYKEHIDLPDLVLRLLAADRRVAAYPIQGRWLDIGRTDDYERAVADFEQHRNEFLPDE